MIPSEESKNGKVQKVRRSEVQLYGASPSSCGYCPGDTESSLSYGVVSQSMLAEDYETLMLIGWRRAGTYFYKPVMYATCCPAYTIRLEASRFAISKKQRQVLRRIERYIESGSVLQSDVEQNKNNAVTSMLPAKEKESSVTGKSIPYKSNKKNESESICAENTENIKKKPPVHILECETTAAEFTTERYELYKKYQISVHGDDPCKITPSGFKRFLVESPLFDVSPVLSSVSCDLKETGTTERKMKIVKPSNTEKIEIGIGMEAKNNTIINCTNTKNKIKEDKDKDNVRDDENIKEKNIVWNYGTYHQLYRLDGRLVAVGVVDILPSGLSSVYLFYDPDEKLLSLGKYTAIKEIEFCIKNNFKYYYMGFYIHSCKKMKYKGEYEPSELLCPTALDWHSFKTSIIYLNKNKFTPLNPFIVKEFQKNLNLEIETKKELQKMVEKDKDKEKEKEKEEMESENNYCINQSTLTSNNGNSMNENSNKPDNNLIIKNNHTDIQCDKETVKIDGNIEEENYETQISNEISPLEKMKNPMLQKFAPNFYYCSPCTTSSLPQEECSVEFHRLRTMHSYVASSVFESFSRGKKTEKSNENESTQQNGKNNKDKNNAVMKQKIAEREELRRVPLDFGGGRRLYSIEDVKGQEREFVATHLKEWVDLCGPKISPKVIVKF